MCNIDSNGKIITYTGDLCLLLSKNTWENVKRKTTVEVNKVFDESSKLKLTLI